MFISLQALEQRPLEFQEEFPPRFLDLGEDLRQTEPLRASGRATLIEEHHGHKEIIQDIRVVGDFSTSIEVNCARCLEAVSREVKRHFDLLYRPQGSDAGREEIAVADTEAEVGYYQGDGLLLEDVLREQILLAVPIKTVCREECKGLCPVCGRNRNTGACDCAEAMPDPRWEALKKLGDRSL
jgi:uncharacterized protein